MNTKKFLAVVVTLCLLLCAMLPMAASAAPGQITQYLTLVNNACSYNLTTGGMAMVTVPAGELITVNVSGGTGAEVSLYAAADGTGNPADYQVILSRLDQPWFNGEGNGVMGGDRFEIVNANSYAINVRFTVVAGGPSVTVGTYDHPEVLTDMQVGYRAEMTATFMRATDAYFYEWTAPADGEFSVTVMGTDGPGGAGSVGWKYWLENADAGLYGDPHWSNDDPVTATDSISVRAGQSVVIGVITFNPNNFFAVPDGSVTVKVGFQQYGAAELPYPLSAGVNEYTITDDLGHYAYTAENDTKIVLSGAGAAQVYAAGTYEDMTADADGNYSVTLAAGESIILKPAPAATTGSDITFTVSEKGSEEWPIEVEADEEYTASNTWSFTYYTFAAEKEGTLVLDFGDYTDWMVVVGDDEYFGDGQISYLELDVTEGETTFGVMDWGWSWDGEFAVEFETEEVEEDKEENKEDKEEGKPPFDDNPKTGVSIALPVLAMLVSACGAALIGKKKF